MSRIPPSLQLAAFASGIPLKKGGSGRKYFRVKLDDGTSAVLCHYDDTRPENALQADISAFLKKLGFPIPGIFAWDKEARAILFEDAGEVDLWALREAPWPLRRDAYRVALQALHHLHTQGCALWQSMGDARPCLMPGFDDALYFWEREYFIKNAVQGYLKITLDKKNVEALEIELQALAGRLLALPRQLVHRDCQSQNILFKDNSAFFIDFQGMREGTGLYDLASLLYDPYVEFSDAQRDELLLYYQTLGMPEGMTDMVFKQAFRDAAAQRLMQALGAYGFLGNTKGRKDFLVHIRPALKRLCAVTQANPSLPHLHELAKTCLGAHAMLAPSPEAAPASPINKGWGIPARANQYQHIFVDLFDTTIFRHIHPFEVIKIWADKIRHYFKIKCDNESLYKIRMDAIPQSPYGPLSYTYQEWMQALFIRLKNSNLLSENIPFEKFLNVALDLEEIIERNAQFANSEIVEQLKIMKNGGKKIYVVSDFYLPQSSVERFIKNLNLTNLFDKVFVSCEFGLTKASALLYPAILEKLNLAGREVFMIGDNYHSDCVNSKKHGLGCFHVRNKYNSIPRKIFARFFAPDVSRKNFLRACAEYERVAHRGEFHFGEYVLAYYFFTDRLFSQLKQRGIRNVLFLSREGFLLKKFYEIYQESFVPVDERIRAHYLRISRQAAAILRYKPLGEEIFFTVGDISIRNFLVGCGFSAEKIQTLDDALDVDFSLTIKKFKSSKELKILLENAFFRNTYEKSIAANKEAFLRYYQSLAIPQKEEVAIVDIGWTGRMQDAVHEITGQKTVGFYLGLMKPSSLGEGCHKEGLLFSTIPCRSPFYDILCVNRQLYEQLLMAPHGSVTSYSLDASGSFVINEDYREEERTAYKGTVEPVQAYMLELFQHLCDDVRVKLTHWGARDWLYPSLAGIMIRSGLWVNAPRRLFLEAISRGFVANFGNIDVGIRYNFPGDLSRGKWFSFLSAPGKLMKYGVKICTLRSGLVRTLLLVFFVIPYFIFLRIYCARWKGRGSDVLFFTDR
ncbi:MAG: phosphotransferase [Puniceicoccales bacterium]|jgi:aminoglycoside/choline kinase family phosphotransferase/FMN phosphatase YigB (HAD superfamily)|nr:phosphotransferase [Puniceicoccales bacterium]